MANLERANKDIEPQQGWGFQGEFKRANQQQNLELTNKNKNATGEKKQLESWGLWIGPTELGIDWLENILDLGGFEQRFLGLAGMIMKRF